MTEHHISENLDLRRVPTAAYRPAVVRPTMTPGCFFLLRGVIWCAKCERRMVGRSLNGRLVYVCWNHITPDQDKRCYQIAGAEFLEAFIKDAAITLLECLNVAGQQSAGALSGADAEAIEADRAELSKLKAMWDSQEIRTAQYRQMCRTVEDRIRKVEATVWSAAEVLEGMTGPDARRAWEAHEKAGHLARLNMVLRLLLAAIRIDENRSPLGGLDYGRVSIELNSRIEQGRMPRPPGRGRWSRG